MTRYYSFVHIRCCISLILDIAGEYTLHLIYRKIVDFTEQLIGLLKFKSFSALMDRFPFQTISMQGSALKAKPKRKIIS